MPPTRKRKSVDTTPKKEEKEEEEDGTVEEPAEKIKEVKEVKKKKQMERKKKNKVQESDEEISKVEEDKSTKALTPTKEDEKVATATSSSRKKEDEREKKNKEVLSKVVWEWAGDTKTGSQNKWIKYSDKVTLLLEEAYQNKDKELKLDAERFIDLANMLQRRYDDPNKRRGVQRFMPDLSVSRTDVEMVTAVLSHTPPNVNKILNALGQMDLDTEEQKRWDLKMAYPLTQPYHYEVFDLATERASIRNILKVPLLLNNLMLKKCLAQVVTYIKYPAVEEKRTDYDHSKLSTFYNSKSFLYKRDHFKDDLDARGNVQGNDYELGKDGAFTNFVVLIGLYNSSQSVRDAQCANLVPILERKGFTIILCYDLSITIYNLDFADAALLIDCPSWVGNEDKFMQFHKKGGGIGLFSSDASLALQNSLIASFLKTFNIQLAGTIAGQGTLAAADGMASKGQFARHLLTSGINNLFAGQNQNCITVDVGGKVKVLGTDATGYSTMCYMDSCYVNSGVLTGRLFVDGDVSKFNENFNLAGVERLISNVAVWLLGLDVKQANDVKLYGKLTLQNFPTVPPFVSNVPILTPSMSYSGSSSSLPTYHPHYSANLISPLPMTSSYNTSNLYDGHLLYPSPFNTSISTSSYTSTLQTPSIHNSSLNSSYSTTFPLYGSNLTSSPHSTSSLTLPTLLPPSYFMPPFSTGSLSTNWTQLPSTPLPSLFHLSPTPKTYPFQK